MPRRLRVAFAAQQFLTLPCATGTFTRTGRNATLSYVQNQVIEDTWTKLSGSYSFGDSRGGPNINQGWTQSGIDTNRGYPFLAQGYAQNANAGTFFFNTSLGYWERTNDIQNDWHRNTGVIMENYDVSFDAERNVFWRSSGGPFGGNPNVGAGQNEAGPWLGDGKYNVTTDEWSTPWPVSYSAWVPLPGDTGYFGTPGATLGTSNHAAIYCDDHVWAFGGWTRDSRQRLHKRNIVTGTISEVVAYPNGPTWVDTGPARNTRSRSGIIRWNKTLYTLADNAELWTYSIIVGGSSWTHITTTGDRPNVPNPTGYPSHPGADYGLICSVDEAANCLVAWVCRNEVEGGAGGSEIRKTWILDLATRVWRQGPSAAGGHTVPTAGGIASKETMLYDPVQRRILLTSGIGNITEVWAFNTAPVGGIITSWHLPTATGGTYGTNYYGFPFTTNYSCKHVNMAYCPLNDRLYATGGDTIHSATDGTWSMDMTDGSWRLDVGEPVYGSVVAPHAYQDGALFEWMPSRNKLLFFGGLVFGYDDDGDPLYNYSSGYWMFDPIAGTWEQVAKFFTNPTLYHAIPNDGNDYGGVYDEDTDTVYVLGDSGSSATARRFNIGTGVQDSSIAYTIPASGISGFVAAYFQRTRLARLGRYIYAVGYYTNGVNSAPANCHAAFWRYGIDDHTFVRLADPPAFTQNVDEKELVLCVSNGKIVHPRRYGTQGDMPDGILVYNPANDTWEADTKTPAYGAFIQNSVTSLPDGRVVMAGGVFGSQQTNLWFYEAT